MGLRKNISKNKYIFSDYNKLLQWSIVNVPLTTMEYNINFGLGIDF